MWAQRLDCISPFKFMRKPYGLFSILILFIVSISCNENSSKSNRVISIQPFGNISSEEVSLFYKEIKKINPKAILQTSIPLPQNAYYLPRNRYRADSLIKFLNKFGNEDTVIIGITNKDISTTKNNYKDWGVMGLGYCPGNACVISTFRLSKLNKIIQTYKVGIHELGHTQGLPHCKNNNCYMRDAEGENPLNEEIYFCDPCKSFLIEKGWEL